jgi:proteasome-associated ATPase
MRRQTDHSSGLQLRLPLVSRRRGRAVSLAGSESERFVMEFLRDHPDLLTLFSRLGGDDSPQQVEEEVTPTMSKEKQLFESYQKLVSGAPLSQEEERGIIDQVAHSDAPSLPHLCLLFANQKRQAQAELAKAREARTLAETALAQLRQPPLFPADVLHVYADGRLDVMVGGRRQVVVAAPELQAGELRAGDEVFLDRDATTALMRNEAPRRTGVVGTVVEADHGRVVLRTVGEEEVVAACALEMAATLCPGDRVLYKRETQCILARLEERLHNPHQLDRPPPVCFSDIGGLDDIIADIRRDLDLHLLHPEVVATYGLRLMRGLILAGVPGVGKTLIAAAIANYLSEMRSETRFLHVKPGSLRGMYYGETEGRIRDLFAVARRAPGLVIIFFDELDNFGARGMGPGQHIDDRVMAALLEELNGLASADNVLCIGATNRLDLCDEALVRQGRFGDRMYQVPRPGRAATRDIFSKYLTPNLPYAPAGASAETIIEAAVGYLFAARDGAGAIATVTLATGTRREVTAPEVMNGALIASAVERAKHLAAERHLHGEDGVRLEDVLGAIDQALAAEAHKLNNPAAARRNLDFPGAEDIMRVDLPAHRRPRRYRYLRAA